ncbi:hypothetical protein D3C79_48550 [compost metagenome]
MGMVKAVLNGVVVVGEEEDLNHIKYGYEGSVNGKWGPYEPATEHYAVVSFQTHDHLQEQFRSIWAERKEDLPAVYKALQATDCDFMMDHSFELGVTILEYLVTLPEE